MTIDDIKELIKNDETRTLELKKTTGEIKNGMHTACAFLNTDGGWLIFGVSPVGLRIEGQVVTDNTRQEIANALTGIEPVYDVRVEYVDIPERKNHQLIAMFFEPFIFGKHPFTYHGCPYYKVESTTKIMPREMYDSRLKDCDPFKFAWDAQIAEEYTIEDLDEERIRSAVRLGVMGGRLNASADGDNVEMLLRKLNLLKDGKITRAAVVLFAKNTGRFSQILLRMAYFRGVDKREFVDNKMIAGNFFDQLDAAIEFCFRHLSLRGKIVGLRREECLEIPQEALREGIVNALCHRFYERPEYSVSLAIYYDRIEINNPGRFPPPLNAENIKQPHESYPYNCLIANVLYLTTYLERWGSGVSRMVEICRESRVPEPVYKTVDGIVSLVFPKFEVGDNISVTQNVTQNVTQKKLTERQIMLLEMIQMNFSISVSTLAEKIGVSPRTIRRDLKIIGVYWDGPAKSGHWEISGI